MGVWASPPRCVAASRRSLGERRQRARGRMRRKREHHDAAAAGLSAVLVCRDALQLGPLNGRTHARLAVAHSTPKWFPSETAPSGAAWLQPHTVSKRDQQAAYGVILGKALERRAGRVRRGGSTCDLAVISRCVALRRQAMAPSRCDRQTRRDYNVEALWPQPTSASVQVPASARHVQRRLQSYVLPSSSCGLLRTPADSCEPAGSAWRPRPLRWPKSPTL